MKNLKTKEEFVNEKLSKSWKNRFEGVVSERKLSITKDYLRIMFEDWAKDGFSKDDIEEYFSEFIQSL